MPDINQIRKLLFLLIISALSVADAAEKHRWDTIERAYSDGKALVLHTPSGTKRFHELVDGTESLSIKNDDILVIEDLRTASRTKTLSYVEMATSDKGIVLLRSDLYRYDTLSQRAFGCSILFSTKKNGSRLNKDDIITKSAICDNYELLEDGRVLIRSGKAPTAVPTVTTGTSRAQIPVFYGEGTLLGYHMVSGLEEPSDLLFPSSILEDAAFRIVNTKTSNIVELNNLGYFLEQSGRYRDAVRVLLKVLELSPERTVAYINIADAYYSLGERKKACNNYRIYVEKMERAGKVEIIPSRVREIVNACDTEKSVIEE